MTLLKRSYHAWVDIDGALIVQRPNDAIEPGHNKQRMRKDLGTFVAVDATAARHIANALRGEK